MYKPAHSEKQMNKNKDKTHLTRFIDEHEHVLFGQKPSTYHH